MTQRLLTVLGAALLFSCGGAQHSTPPPSDAGPAPTSAAPTLLPPGVSQGTFADGDPVDVHGHHRAEYAVSGPAGSVARVTLSSASMDVLLRAHLPDGRELVNDDFAGTDARLQFAIPAGGIVRVEATTFAPGVQGAYDIELALLDPSAEPSLPTDGAVDANLLDRADAGQEPVSTGHWFRATRGERIHVRVTSPDFDTIATVYSPAGLSWTNDDANDTGPDGAESLYDSTVSFVAPDDGAYQLVVAAYAEPGDGRYRVATTRQAAPVLGPAGELPVVGYAGAEGNGRIYAVLAGVTLYSGEPLYGCADDATFLAEAFDARGLVDEAGLWLLTDKAATRAALEAALAEVAQVARPEDLVVIFFSGHGNVHEAAPGDALELDGTDESIVLADGEVLDNELVGWIDAIGAGSVLLAVDACHSGGLARDFMTRPGRIGLFSSDEDVLSSTAEVVGAGGFLSYHLRQALAGVADARPLDGALTAGELTDYLMRGFLEHHAAMNPEGSNAPYQRLVVERGSFGWDDLLLVFPRTASGEDVPPPTETWHSGPVSGDAAEAGTCQ